MPALGKDRRGLVGHAFDSDDMRMAGNGRDERVLTEGAEMQRERFQLRGRQFLVWESQHLMLQPGRTQRRQTDHGPWQ